MLVPPPVSPARGPPTEWAELVQAHDERDAIQSTDRRCAGDRHPQPLSGAGRDPRMSGNCELGRGLRRREKNDTPEGEGMREGYGLREPGDGNTRLPDACRKDSPVNGTSSTGFRLMSDL